MHIAAPASPNSTIPNSILQWSLLIAAIAFGTVVLWDFNFLNYLVTYDTSRISLIIIGVFVAYSLYCFYVLTEFTQELSAAERLTGELEKGEVLVEEGAGLRIGNYTPPPGLLLTSLLSDISAMKRIKTVPEPDLLLQSFAAQLRVPGRRGLFIADVMYKLGMLGTVIGFVVMLVALDDIGDYQVEAMRGALAQMTSGMAVALLTTITGLVCGVLLRLQFNIVDALARRVLHRVVRLTELFILPAEERKG